VGRNGERELKQYASNSFRGADPLEISSKLDFFLEVSAHCERTKFKTPLERLIMERFCEGETKEEIRQRLDGLGITVHRTTIYNVIKRYLILYGLHGK
jgi:hypothetical protein